MASNDCGNGALNTGQPSCVPKKSVDAGIIFVNYLNDAGTVNFIPSGTTVDSTFVSGLINNADKSVRWYPAMNIKSVVGERADNVTQDIDGIAYNVKRGVRAYDGSFYGNFANPKFVKALESRASIQDAYFKVDINGNLTGIEDESGNVAPIKIQSSTLQVKYKEPTVTELQMVNLKFSVDESQNDSDLVTLDSQTVTTDLLSIAGLIDVTGVSTSPATTGFVLTTKLIYGNPFALPAFSGAVLADFVLYNTTTSSSITATSVTEGADGVYTFVMPAQTSADEVTVDLSKDGFEMSTVTVTIP